MKHQTTLENEQIEYEVVLEEEEAEEPEEEELWLGDLEDYLYQEWRDIRGKEIYFRPLKGWWPESLGKSPDFKRLIEKDVEKE
jgi:hypothetical protein